MIGALVLAGMMAVPNTGPADWQSAMVLCKRLVAAAAVDPTGGTPEELAAWQARLEEFRDLQIYLVKLRTVMEIGRWTAQDSSNYRQVVRQLVTTGTGCAVLPEEVLAWQRVGLILSYEQYRMAQGRV